MPFGQTINVHMHITNHISARDIREKTLFLNPIPNSIKDGQNLDEYIKEFSAENKKIHITC